MTIELVYRVRCSGPCRRWLSLPDDYTPGEDTPLGALVPQPTAAYAGMWPDETAARRAAFAAGWSSGICPDCRVGAEARQDGVQQHASRPAVSPQRRRGLVHNAITNALAAAGEWVPLSTRIAATRAALAEVEAWHADAPEPKAAAQQGDPLCICMHRRSRHPKISGRLLCDECDPDSTENLVCKEYTAL